MNKRNGPEHYCTVVLTYISINTVGMILSNLKFRKIIKIFEISVYKNVFFIFTVFMKFDHYSYH